MTNSVNLALLRRDGDIHASVFIEPVLFLKKYFVDRGWKVSITDNHLSQDCINIVFGAHAVPGRVRDEKARLIIFNLEPLGVGSPFDTVGYRELLSASPTIDYDGQNLKYYHSHGTGKFPPREVVTFSDARYPVFDKKIPVSNRSSDLLFFGSLNPYRVDLLRKIANIGVRLRVITPSQPVYGVERDKLILCSSAVLNLPYYENAPFEQVRVYHVLSLGTPVISHIPNLIPEGYSKAVTWVNPSHMEEFFRVNFRSVDWFTEAEVQLTRWRECSASIGLTCLEEFVRNACQEYCDPTGQVPKFLQSSSDNLTA
jgi:hypothetical protein